MFPTLPEPQPQPAEDRWVVVSDDPNDRAIRCIGPYLWDGVTPWQPPVAGRLVRERDAIGAGYTYPTTAGGD